MGPGGSVALSATGAPDPLLPKVQAPPARPAFLPRGLFQPAAVSLPHHVCENQTATRATDEIRLPCLRAGPDDRAPPGARAALVRATSQGMDTAERSPPSAIRTARLRSVARLPPAAYQPGRLPGAFPALAEGSVVLGRGSRLDAFSGSPVRTWLPSGAGYPTTGSPAVRPTRSSRTRVSPPHASKRLRRIETELSHDVLNPARVPL